MWSTWGAGPPASVVWRPISIWTGGTSRAGLRPVGVITPGTLVLEPLPSMIRLAMAEPRRPSRPVRFTSSGGTVGAFPSAKTERLERTRRTGMGTSIHSMPAAEAGVAPAPGRPVGSSGIREASMKKIGVIGSGDVGEALANGFLTHGYDVMRASRDPGKLAEWKTKAGGKAATGTLAEAAAFGELVTLAVKGAAAEEAVRLCGPDALAGKTVIDTTNPIAETPPVNGVLGYFTGPDESLMERLQRLAPRARFVKAFSCVGSRLMVHPDFGGEKPTMFLCGNDAAAKKDVERILGQFGWEWEDLGKAEAARAIEPLAMLWCIPGFLHDRWNHAFRLLRR